MIYRTIVFGHRNCFGTYREGIGSSEGVPGTPDKIWALWAKGGYRPAHKGLVRPYIGWPYEEEKERWEGKESVE